MDLDATRRLGISGPSQTPHFPAAEPRDSVLGSFLFARRY